jgi:hypothetical protein
MFAVSINAATRYRFNELEPDISVMAYVFNFRLLMGLDIIKKTARLEFSVSALLCTSFLSNHRTSNTNTILFAAQPLHIYPFRDEGIPEVRVYNMSTTDGSFNK